MFTMTLKLNSEKNKQKELLAGVVVELTKYTKKSREVDKLKKEGKKLQQKIDIIVTLENTRKEPVALFTALTEVVVPERMWLNSFVTKGKNIMINGTALDEITVADFAKRLEVSPVFVNVVLKSLKVGTSNKVSVKTFEIDCKISDIKKKETMVSGKAVK